MDRNKLFLNIKMWWPIVVTIISLVFNFISFLADIDYNWNNFSILGSFALLATIFISFLFLFVYYKIAISGENEDFTILSSVDEYCILTPNKAIYKRVVKVRVNRPMTQYYTFMPNPDGKITNINVYYNNHKDTQFSSNVRKLGGRKILYIQMDRKLVKGDIIDGLCIECELTDSFLEEHEGVSVDTDPHQENCDIIVSLPKDYPPSLGKINFLVHYEKNTTPIDDGSIEYSPISDNSYIFSHNFSNIITKKEVAYTCALYWHWSPDNIV
ncbi:MAG: hypothetical protein H0S79_16465 [Anaerolineaceae bacterium]|nr:hypothetical protein [Anaerolineaceae bacterium]